MVATFTENGTKRAWSANSKKLSLASLTDHALATTNDNAVEGRAGQGDTLAPQLTPLTYF
jgi:hypothetical protein